MSADRVPPPLLLLGHPRFDDPDLQTLAQQEGAGAAWRVAFARHGLQAPARVSGAFAVGLTDAQGRTWLAVDRFAAQTLCFRLIGSELTFAERADTLARLPPRATIDAQALFDYLFLHAIASPRTVFDGVSRLPPARVARFEHGQLTVQRYWTPAFTDPSPRSVSFEALRDEFRAQLRGAVERELPAQGAPACFLSGGTDSSTVAGLIGEVAGQPAHTYSIGFEAEGYDEMAYARIAARHFGCTHHEYYVTPDDLVRSIGAVAAHHDQPFGNSSALPAYYCALKAREDGVHKLLAGDGGDELFGGNSRYARQRVFGWWDAVPGALRAGVVEPLFGLPLVARTPGLKKGASYIEQARVPLPERLQMYNLMLRLGLNEVLTADFMASVDPRDTTRQQREVWRETGEASDVNRMLAFDWRYTLAESDLPKVRGSTQLAGIDVGYPFLDRAVVDFSLGLPSAFKLKGLKLRWFFKEALRGFLPDAIITKKKQGFGLPFGVWANRHAGLRELAVGSLNSLAQRGVVRPAFIRTLIDTHLPAYPGYYGEMVWILMMLEQWLAAHAPDWRLAESPRAAA